MRMMMMMSIRRFEVYAPVQFFLQIPSYNRYRNLWLCLTMAHILCFFLLIQDNDHDDEMTVLCMWSGLPQQILWYYAHFNAFYFSKW